LNPFLHKSEAAEMLKRIAQVEKLLYKPDREIPDKEQHSLEFEYQALMNATYAGRRFRFCSPFEGTQGWKNGDTGTLLLVTQPPKCGEDVFDMWTAFRDRDGIESEVWGGECFDEKTGEVLIPSQGFDMEGWTRYETALASKVCMPRERQE